MPSVTFSPDRERPPETEVERLVADRSKAERLLGWTPRVALDDGLRRTIDWFGSYLDSYSVYKRVTTTDTGSNGGVGYRSAARIHPRSIPMPYAK